MRKVRPQLDQGRLHRSRTLTTVDSVSQMHAKRDDVKAAKAVSRKSALELTARDQKIENESKKGPRRR